jgi:SpoVK/Ycf46/Vps4 family AAA+-type ATPase
MLSPGDFIARGLEYIETQARSVFDRLLRLSRAVILFDECDELFRERKPNAGTEQTRGITAFVTASMLPKLQELHDSGRVVFFICTNNFESMDLAVKRGGRIDHIIGVGPPDRAARKRVIDEYFKNKFKSKMPRWVAKAASELEMGSGADRYIRSELHRACEMVAEYAPFTTEDDIRVAVSKVLDRMSESLTIRQLDLDHYLELKKKFSRPVIDAAK